MQICLALYTFAACDVPRGQYYLGWTPQELRVHLPLLWTAWAFRIRTPWPVASDVCALPSYGRWFYFFPLTHYRVLAYKLKNLNSYWNYDISMTLVAFSIQLYYDSRIVENCCPSSAYSIGFDHRFIYLSVYWIMSMLFSDLKTYGNQLCISTTIFLWWCCWRHSVHTLLLNVFWRKTSQKNQKTHLLTRKDSCTRCVRVVLLEMNVNVTQYL